MPLPLHASPSYEFFNHLIFPYPIFLPCLRSTWTSFYLLLTPGCFCHLSWPVKETQTHSWTLEGHHKQLLDRLESPSLPPLIPPHSAHAPKIASLFWECLCVFLSVYLCNFHKLSLKWLAWGLMISSSSILPLLPTSREPCRHIYT